MERSVGKVWILGVLLAVAGVGCIEVTPWPGAEGPGSDSGSTMTDPDAGTMEPEPDASSEVGAVGMFLQIGDETPSQLYELTVDADTYAEIVDAVGHVPDGLIEGEPSREPGTRSVTPVVSSVADSRIFEGISRSERGASTDDLGRMRILFGGGVAQPIGLLLPAVQKVRAAAARSHTTLDQVDFELTFELPLSDTEVSTITYTGLENQPPPSPPPFVDVSGDSWAASPEMSDELRARQLIDVETDFRVDGDLRFSRASDGSLLLQPWTMDEPDSADYTIWRETGGQRSLVLDIQDRIGGRVLHRFRIPRADLPTDIDSGMMSASMSGYLKIGDIKGESTDARHEIELFDTHFVRPPTSTEFDLARRQLGLLSTRSTATLVDSWTTNRDATIRALRAASVQANDQEGLLCVTMMPLLGEMMLALQAGLDDGSIPETRELRRILADYYEAYELLGEPEHHAFIGGDLASAAYDRPLDAADAEVACGAIPRIMGVWDDTDIVHILVDSDAQALGDDGRDLLIGGSGRYFDDLVVELIERLDRLAADPTSEPVATPIDALLIINRVGETLDQHQSLAVSRYRMSDVLVSSYR